MSTLLVTVDHISEPSRYLAIEPAPKMASLDSANIRGGEHPTEQLTSSPQQQFSSSPAAPSPATTARSTARLTALQAKQDTLSATLATLLTTHATLVANAKLPSGLPLPDDLSDEERSAQALASASAVAKEHIGLLHTYNEIKDIGQGLLGLVAEGRGVRIRDLGEEFSVGEAD